MRNSSRKDNQMRSISIELNVLRSAHGSCKISFGNTEVICSAMMDEGVPGFLRNTGSGWVTAEYSMLPCATHTRTKRDVVSGKPSGRTQEIQRLIGRSLRAVVDLKKLGERQIIVDCDVINADGGTRTASITGGYVALYMAIKHLMQKRILSQNPLIAQVAALSCGIVKGDPLLDLDYSEDSIADVDANFVYASPIAGANVDDKLRLIEIQASAERNSFSQEELMKMLELSNIGCQKLFSEQNKAILLAQMK